MSQYRFLILYIALMMVQVVLNVFFDLSGVVTLSLLPVLVLLLPVSFGRVALMLMAFATGFVVDFFSTGLLGLSSVALVPVALLRRETASLVFGRELFIRGDEISYKRFGVMKTALAALLSNLVFFAVFVPFDNAGIDGFWRCLLRVVLSALASTVAAVFAARLKER